MKIRDISPLYPGMPAVSGPEEKQTSADSSRSFKRHMTDMAEETYKKYLGELADKIDAQGALLSKRADITELQKYRKMIAEFLHEAVSNAFAFQKSGSFDSRGRHRVFAIIKSINAKIEEITEDVLKGQGENIDLLHKIDDIRGLIVDLLL